MIEINIVDRFLKYVKFDTQSNEKSSQIPSTIGQTELLNYLYEELKLLGVKNIDLDCNNGILYAKIPSNIKENNLKSIGFIAHLDTASDASGKNVQPRIIENYNGEDIILSKDIILKTSDFPEILEYKNKSLIVTDGTTLLGADDKAGIAEIMSMVEFIMRNPKIRHKEICIAFTPDEEIGRSIEKFDIKRFGANFAYTIDGEKMGEISYENFNAVRAKVMITGRNIHPGYAKNKMINACCIACEFNEQIPKYETPRNTEKYEGFYHLINIAADVEKAEIIYHLRDFEKENMKNRIQNLKTIAEKINKKYGEKIITIEFNEQYKNMKEYIKEDMELISNAQEVGKRVGIESFIQPIRGGVDGADLTIKGLPCPNLGAGGRNFHSIYEYVCIDDMKKITELLIELVKVNI